jgi:hypothetical protein
MACNGWANRDTWLVNLHGFFGDGYFAECKFASVDEAEDAMKSSFDDWFQEETKGFHPLIKDLLSPEVDWRQLAEHYYSDWKSSQPPEVEDDE